ncbi:MULTISPECIES: hypothetical protein [Streptomyces]|uniref:Uncharacterized protein n=1 Tax=Streptomyces venezuelae (strain ATCC 10712 / CBS 650.69 / DSM 40230 / JCM 4526 / NBRC 13096 / PD 04745) TaxID=953739 RepID=F2RKY9_STRVP|nr:hypothetical protein [Streptomyces venezuelae]APE21359.1 hypothetical protein vnz_10230 [Streptomyces venezuelae]QER98749.1 hypothetical protein DEJ43_10355 [Streptomyces venezuelae ATCC 10712]CCA55378.1 hypothetical protein SVEN_2092 [Streptomyces venezuelae ATCC 10712]
MPDDFTPEDIAAMRREGDLSSFLREQLRAGRARREQPVIPAPRRPTGRPPGAWPTNATPVSQTPSRHTAADWTRALDEYRQWLTTTNHPELMDQGQTCGCTGCTPPTQKEDQ